MIEFLKVHIRTFDANYTADTASMINTAILTFRGDIRGARRKRKTDDLSVADRVVDHPRDIEVRFGGLHVFDSRARFGMRRHEQRATILVGQYRSLERAQPARLIDD